MTEQQTPHTHRIQRGAVLLHRVGTPWFFFTAGAVGALIIFRFYTPEAALLFVLSLLVTISMVGILKVAFRVPRPINAYEELNSFAFPSGHAAGAFFLAVYVSYFALLFLAPTIAWTITILAFFIASAVSVSRAVLQVHTALQVVVGALIGNAVPLVTLMQQHHLLDLVTAIALLM